MLSDSITVFYSFFPEEDKYGSYAKLLVKYFLAEGIVSGHSLIVASQDSDCETLVCYVWSIICVVIFVVLRFCVSFRRVEVVLNVIL